MSAYTEAVRELACEILELMAEGLGVPDTSVFSRLIKDVDSDSVLRLNHYPPIVNRECKDRDKSLSYNYAKVGFGEHSDPQILTILRSNDVGGLQISPEHGVWIPVTPDPSAFCVNVGDVLEVCSYIPFLMFQFSTPRPLIHFAKQDKGGWVRGRGASSLNKP